MVSRDLIRGPCFILHCYILMPDMMTMSAGDKSSKDSGELDFALPQGMSLEPGEEKTMDCVIRGKGQGIACIVSVNGEPVSEYGEDSGGSEPDEDDQGTPPEPDQDESASTEGRAVAFRKKFQQAKMAQRGAM